MGQAVLVDTTRCIGCRACQVSCKSEHDLPAEQTTYTGQAHGLTNPPALSAKTFTLVQNHEVEDPQAVGGMRLIFTKRQCMHCESPACVSACPATALHKAAHGGVAYDASKCIGCRYCVWACPFGVPTAEWDSLAPRIRKCDLCTDRILGEGRPKALNGAPLTRDARDRLERSYQTPACVKACTTRALVYGKREELIEAAHQRMAASPGRYHPHLYGEKEVGGTGVLYLSSVPFERLGFRVDLGETAYPTYTANALGLVPGAVIGLGLVLGGVHLLAKRKEAVALAEAPVAPGPSKPGAPSEQPKGGTP
jgi:formate dehydrogenase iron-sulfur subunit